MTARAREIAVSPGVRSKDPGELSKYELWLLGCKLLGYGDWTPDNPEPFQKWAGMESHKLYLVMRKRRITNEEFLLCVRYCQRHHKRIENAVWVFRFINEAKQEQRELLAQTPTTELGLGIEEALRRERALSDDQSTTWIGRLTRAVGPYRDEVLSEWRAARQQ